MKLLIIEDDINILSFLKRGFKMLPLKNGIEVLKSLRTKNILTPILMLTAKGEIKDKIQGLKGGCDDYLSKPFSFDELEAKIEALYRRSLFF